ncbi:MAG: MCE family protein [Aeromicrobium sp.]|uniref:MCE family protein n=1 Tax=Aeromicrobium sp. TaxID=1871063 RepID=UPI0039E64FDE
MSNTPTLDRPSVVKILGIGFVCLMLFFVWVTWAFFNRSFVSTEDVTLKAPKAGSQLPMRADVKLRGMIVGEVTDMEVVDDGVEMTLGLDPDLIDEIPAGVEAQILPKTLFGEKYIALIPPEQKKAGSLKAGDVIQKADVPIELESVLNNLYTLLEAVSPAELATTLTAVSTALDGRGEKLGDTLVDLNAYLAEINPDIPKAVDDIVKLGEVSDVYAAALPDLARVLENSVVTGDTVVEKQAQLTAFLASTTTLANTLTSFVGASGDALIQVNADSRRSLYQTARYSTTFPCFLSALDNVMPRLESVFRDNSVHIDLEIISPTNNDASVPGGMPNAYAVDENVDTTYDELNADQNAALVAPTCYDLDELAQLEDQDQGPYPQAQPYKGPMQAADLYQLVGAKSAHGKFFNYVVPAGETPDPYQSNWQADPDTWNRSAVPADELGQDVASLLLGEGTSR